MRKEPKPKTKKTSFLERFLSSLTDQIKTNIQKIADEDIVEEEEGDLTDIDGDGDSATDDETDSDYDELELIEDINLINITENSLEKDQGKTKILKSAT